MRDVVIDTCVWIDICADVRAWPLLEALEKLVVQGKVRLVVPALVFSEATKHLPSTPERAVRSGQARIKDLRSLLGSISSDGSERISNELDRFNELLDSAPKGIKEASDRGMKLITEGLRLDPTPEVNAKAIERGLQKRAPFNKGAKNSMADAVIAELILEHAEQLRANSDSREVLFLSSNRSDFSSKGDQRNPHEDFAKAFAKLGIRYEINVAEVVEELAKDLESADEQRALARLIAERDLKSRLPVDIAMPLTEKCSKCGESAQGGYRPSSGGLSWCLSCPRCGFVRDTGEYFD